MTTLLEELNHPSLFTKEPTDTAGQEEIYAGEMQRKVDVDG